jgi:hypothetical protein
LRSIGKVGSLRAIWTVGTLRPVGSVRPVGQLATLDTVGSLRPIAIRLVVRRLTFEPVGTV